MAPPRFALAVAVFVAFVTVPPCNAARAIPRLPPTLPPHPRLLWTDEGLNTTLSLIATDPSAAALYAVVRAHGELLLADKGESTGFWDYAFTLGALHRIECAQAGTRAPCTTAWGTGATDALLRAASNPDNCGDCPSNNCTGMSFFSARTAGLCTATLGHALAISYDWLYADLNASAREAVAAAITDQILDVYAEGIAAAFVHEYFYESSDNFNTAINSGAIIAALAVAGDPEAPARTAQYAADAFALAVISITRSTAAAFLPDGGHPEGPTYGAFGLNFLQPTLAALQTATGSTYGLATPNATGRYLVDLSVTPSALYVNWADTSGCSGTNAAQLSSGTEFGCTLVEFEYLYVLMNEARKMGAQEPALAYVARAQAATRNATWGFPGHWEPVGVKYLLDFTQGGGPDDLAALVPSALHNDTRLAVLRNGWGSGSPALPTESGSGSVLVAVKGADNHLQQILKATTHTHADGGSFVLDAGGVRWATDLGSGPYLSQGYFALQKWDFYQASTAGHNTLSFGGGPQDACTTWGPTGDPTECQAVVDGFAVTNATGGDAWATLDLTGVYTLTAGPSATVRRGVALRTSVPPQSSGQGGAWVGVRDDFPGAAAGAGNVTWSMHTFAAVRLVSPSRAQLSTVTASGEARLLDVVADPAACAGAAFATWPVPPTTVNVTGLSVLALVGPEVGPECASLAVVMGIAPVPDSSPTLLAQVGAWATSGPWVS